MSYIRDTLADLEIDIHFFILYIMLWWPNSHAAFKTINTMLSTWCNFECAVLCCSLDGSEPLGLRGVGEGAESEELALYKGGNRQSSETSKSWQIYKHFWWSLSNHILIQHVKVSELH